MSRGFALPFAALLLVAVALRTPPPTPPPPPAREVVAAADPASTPAAEPAPPPAPASQPAPEVYVEPRLTVEELTALVEARLPEETILAYARVSGRDFRPTPVERAALRDAGMSDALLGRLEGGPAPETPTPPAVVVVPPPVTVYAPVTVTTVVEAPPPPEPAPYVSTVVLACAHGRHGCCPPPVLDRPAIYGKPPTFKTKTLPTAGEVERRERARQTRIFR